MKQFTEAQDLHLHRMAHATTQAFSASVITPKQLALSPHEISRLSELKDTHGWILCIAPPASLTIAQLEQYGINPNRVIVTRKLCQQQFMALQQQANKSGSVSAVVLWKAPNQLH